MPDATPPPAKPTPKANNTLGLLPTLSIRKYQPDEKQIRAALGRTNEPPAGPLPAGAGQPGQR